MSESTGRITALLDAHARGDDEALRALFDTVYDELRRVARSQRRRGPGSPTLDTGALVHELYLKLAGGEAALGRNRGHFLAIAARAMRHLLVDHARAARRGKRGGGAVRVTLSHADAPVDVEIERVLAIDRGLKKLEEVEPRRVRVVECRHFLGLTEPETAAALGVSLSTVQRDWKAALDWLNRQLGAQGSPVA